LGLSLQVADSRTALATLALEEGRPTQGLGLVKLARKEYRRHSLDGREVWALDTLARQLLHLGRPEDAQKASERAFELARSIENPATRLAATITAARVRSALIPRDEDELSDMLETVAAVAKHSGLASEELEARLTLGELELASVRTTQPSV